MNGENGQSAACLAAIAMAQEQEHGTDTWPLRQSMEDSNVEAASVKA